MSVTSAYTIPSTWTAPTSCFASTNYYRVLLGGNYFSNMYGTPTPVLKGNTPRGDCFPPSYTINAMYTTTGDCPAGFTRACATAGPMSNGQQVSMVTCCPSVTSNVFSFMCKDNEYGCHATATVGVVWTGTLTDIGISHPTEEPITRTPYTEEGLEAWGIKLLSIPAITSATSVAPTKIPEGPASATTKAGTSSGAPTQTGQSSESNGLSTGAIAGIAVGVVAAVGLLGLGAFLLYRRKRKAKATSVVPVVQSEHEDKYAHQHGQSQPYQLDAPERRDQVWEMHG